MIQARAAGDPFEALGDPNRRDILRLLSEGDKPVRDIAAALPISRPAVSRHLRLLREAGLVAEQAQGTRHIYHLQEEGLHAVQDFLVGLRLVGIVVADAPDLAGDSAAIRRNDEIAGQGRPGRFGPLSRT